MDVLVAWSWREGGGSKLVLAGPKTSVTKENKHAQFPRNIELNCIGKHVNIDVGTLKLAAGLCMVSIIMIIATIIP